MAPSLQGFGAQVRAGRLLARSRLARALPPDERGRRCVQLSGSVQQHWNVSFCLAFLGAGPELAFTGRESNPLDRDERFQITFPSPFFWTFSTQPNLPFVRSLRTGGTWLIRIKTSEVPGFSKQRTPSWPEFSTLSSRHLIVSVPAQARTRGLCVGPRWPGFSTVPGTEPHCSWQSTTPSSSGSCPPPLVECAPSCGTPPINRTPG